MMSLRHSHLDLVQPAVADLVLTGHSGARLTLHESHDRSVIRKMAGDPANNVRLRQQAAKQVLFLRAGFSTPRILHHGFSSGLYYFDMDYIPAISIAAQCGTGSSASAAPLADFLTRWILYMQGGSTSMIGRDKVETKIDAVLRACRENAVLTHALPAIALLGSSLLRSEWPNIPESPCHGDLTLENILADANGHLWLIDFDAPDLSSYWFDIAKLYQDLRGHWCLRHVSDHSRSPSRLNAVLAIRRLRSVMDDVLHQAVPELIAGLTPLIVLCLMRALPYCKDIGTAVYILDRARSVMADDGGDN